MHAKSDLGRTKMSESSLYLPALDMWGDNFLIFFNLINASAKGHETHNTNCILRQSTDCLKDMQPENWTRISVM